MPLSINQIEDVFASDSDFNPIYLNIINLNMNDPVNEKRIISHINKLLAASKTRQKALEYLNSIISNCSSEILSENSFNWLNFCIPNKNYEDQLKEVKFLAISNIIKQQHSDQDFTKKFVGSYLSKISESCLGAHVTLAEKESALVCLTTCMEYYASWFAPHQKRIEEFVLGFLDTTTANLVEKAAVAFHYLQQTGGAGSDGINHINNFSNKFHKLCNTIHSLYDAFFEQINEVDTWDRSDNACFEFELMTDLDSTQAMRLTARRIENCLKFISVMMRKKYNVAKVIKPQLLLDIITRGLAVHHCLDNKNIALDLFNFSILLIQMQTELIKILKIFLIWYENNSLLFGHAISKLLIDCLKRCQNCNCFTINSLYQESTYKCLNTWIAIGKSSLNVQFQTNLINCLMRDITCDKRKITLTINEELKNKSNKQKKKAIQAQIINRAEVNGNIDNIKYTLKQNQEINCKYALSTLKQLLRYTALKVNTNLLKDLYNIILSNINDIHFSNISHPYYNIDCQIGLYEALAEIFEQDSAIPLISLPQTIHILNVGINNKNRHISAICEKCLSNLEKLCQPICPSLQIPEARNDVDTEEVDNENELTEEQENILIESTDEDEPIQIAESPERSLNQTNSSDLQIIENEDNEGGAQVNIIDVQIIESQSNTAENTASQEDIVETICDLIESDITEIDNSISDKIEADVINIDENEDTKEPPTKKMKTNEEDPLNDEFDFIDEVKEY